MSNHLETNDDTGNSALNHRFSHWLIRWRNPLCLLSLLLTLMAATGLARVDFDSSLTVLLGQNDPYLAERDALQAIFPAPREISFVFAPQNRDAFSVPTLRALASLQQQYRDIPDSRRINSILNFYSPTGEVSLIPSPWVNFERFTSEQLESARERALDNPLVNGILVSPDTSLALVSITLDAQGREQADNRQLDTAITELLTSLRAEHPEVAIHASAEALFEQSTRQAMINDLSRLLPLVTLLCVLFICVAFRAWVLGAAVLAVALMTVMLTVGTLGWLERPFNTVSIMAPLVVVIIAVADAVHIISVYRQQRATGLSVQAALQHSLAFNLRPVTLATLTTAIGFGSLNMVSAPALSDFGSIVALGVIYAWMITMFMLPAAMLWIAGRNRAAASADSTRFTTGPLQAGHDLFRRYPRAVFRSGVALGLLGLLLLPLNETDFERLDFIGRDSPLHDYYAILLERMDRGPLLTYGVQTAGADLNPDAQLAIEPEFLRALDSFANWLREQPDVISTASLVEVVSAINQTVHDDYRIPDSEDTVRQHLSDYTLVQNERYALGNFVSDDYRTVQLFINTRHLSNRQIIELDQHLSENFPTFMPDARLLHGSGTLLFARMDQRVTVELMQGYGLSLLMITLTLIIGLRSLRYGLLSIIPNAMPAIVVFGFWGLLVGQLDPFVMMLFSVSIGLVVDDTVHVLSTYQRSLAAGRHSTDAISDALFKAGPALLITTAVLALGTVVLIGASTLYFQQAARLLVPIVVLALILDMVWLPTLLQRLDRNLPGASPAVGRL